MLLLLEWWTHPGPSTRKRKSSVCDGRCTRACSPRNSRSARGGRWRISIPLLARTGFVQSRCFPLRSLRRGRSRSLAKCFGGSWDSQHFFSCAPSDFLRTTSLWVVGPLLLHLPISISPYQVRRRSREVSRPSFRLLSRTAI